MTDLLCPANRCRSRGVHKTDCAGCNCPDDGQHRPQCTPCEGCQPRQAAPSYRLCWFHIDRIGPDAIRCAELHHELEEALVGSGSAWINPDSNGGDGDGGQRLETGINLRDAVVQRRHEIRTVLTSWCKLIIEERGIDGPEPDETSLGAFIARPANVNWLAAQQFAGDVVDELAALRSGAWGLLQANNRHRFEIGPCDRDDCTGTVYGTMRATDTLLPPSVRCDLNDQHTWASHEWHRLRDTKVSA